MMNILLVVMGAILALMLIIVLKQDPPRERDNSKHYGDNEEPVEFQDHEEQCLWDSFVKIVAASATCEEVEAAIYWADRMIEARRARTDEKAIQNREEERENRARLRMERQEAQVLFEQMKIKADDAIAMAEARLKARAAAVSDPCYHEPQADLLQGAPESEQNPNG